MKTWMWNADLYCNDCIEETVHRLDAEGVEDDGDSDTYPQDCGNDGGGEADTPQHCGQCHVWLNNELTSDGYDYVADALYEYLRYGHGDPKVLQLWKEGYTDWQDQFNDRMNEWLEEKMDVEISKQGKE